MKNSKLSPTTIRNRVAHAWGLLERYCDAYVGQLGSPHRWLSEAEDEALKGERAHRAMGARFTHGQASYRVPCSVAARAVILSHVYRGADHDGFGTPPPDQTARTWAYFAGIRRDCALAYAIRDCLTTEQIATLSEAGSIDYAEDIAA